MKFLKMKNGTRIPVVGCTGKYWICRDMNIRRSNPDIVEVIERKEKPRKKAEDGKEA